MSDDSTERFSLRVTPTVRRALAERLPEAVAFAAFEFINGPLLDNPYRVGRRMIGTPPAGAVTGSFTGLTRRRGRSRSSMLIIGAVSTSLTESRPK